MKKTIKFAAVALCAAALAISCNKESIQINVEKAQPEMVTFTCQLPEMTKVSITPDGTVGKVAWEEGDEILIHGKHTESGCYTIVKLTKDDISADGKSATISFSGISSYAAREEYNSVFYAAYPASAVKLGEHCYDNTRFNGSDAPFMVAVNEENTFLFQNICGVISFSLNGDFDSYVFSGNNDEIVAYEAFQSRLRSKAAGGLELYAVKDGDSFNCSPLTSASGELKTAGTTNYIFIPGGANFTGGFTFKFKKNGEIVKAATTEEGVNVARNKMLVLGDITSHLTDYEAPTTSDHKSEITDATDLSSAGTANCYVITEAGAYKFPAVKGNSTTEAGNVFGVKLVWETYNNGDDVTANSVIEAVDFEDNWIYFKTPSALQYGNALIAAKDSDGRIIWSWHIWIPKTTITAGSYNNFTGHNIMDRNLGALVVAEAGEGAPDVTSIGFYYQWGRKDPFIGAREYAEYPSKAKVAGEEFSKIGELITVAYSIEHPVTYAYVPEQDESNWTSQPAAAYWEVDGKKSMYDPCPAGYKVPTYDTSCPMWTKTDEGWTWNKNDTAKFWFRHDACEVVFPLAGYIDCWGGSHSKSNQRCILWTATNRDDTTARGAFIRWDKSSVYYAYTISKAKAGSVRCVAE